MTTRVTPHSRKLPKKRKNTINGFLSDHPNEYHKAIAVGCLLGMIDGTWAQFVGVPMMFLGDSLEMLSEFSRRPVLCSQRRRNIKKDLLQLKKHMMMDW